MPSGPAADTQPVPLRAWDLFPSREPHHKPVQRLRPGFHLSSPASFSALFSMGALTTSCSGSTPGNRALPGLAQVLFSLSGTSFCPHLLRPPHLTILQGLVQTRPPLISLLLVKLNALFCRPPQPFACISIVIITMYIANIILGAFCMLSRKFHYTLVRNYYKPHFINGGTEALRTEFISHHTCRKGYSQNFNHVLTVPKSENFSLCSVASLTASWLASCIHRCLARGIAANPWIAGSGHAHPYKCG